MVWVTMSERELQRIEVLTQVVDGRLAVDAAATVLALSRRQVFRLLKSFRATGAMAVRHKARGRPPNNRIKGERRDYALGLIGERYADFGPTLAAEMLAEHHDFTVSRETLRHWMMAAGIWLPRKQRRRFHQPRLRRECLGELIQIDGSEHRWFEQRGEPCTLLVFIDDATSKLMELRFVPSESTATYFEALRRYLQAHGRPVAFYSDKHSVFRAARSDAKNGNGMTQFGRALSELNMEILCANSSEAKGRVERANRTLQDRLIKELRMAGIDDIDAANAYLPGFITRFNRQFAKQPAKSDNLHRPLNIPADRLDDILCWREKRHVGKQLTINFERKRIILTETEQSPRSARPICRHLQLPRRPFSGPMERPHPALYRIRQGPARHPGRHRREQTPGRSPHPYQKASGTAAPATRNQNQQRETRLPTQSRKKAQKTSPHRFRDAARPPTRTFTRGLTALRYAWVYEPSARARAGAR